MKDLPKSFERYLSSLRQYVEKSINFGDESPKQLEKLKKIYVCEAIYYKNHKESVDINMLSASLLRAASYIDQNTEYKIDISGNFIINEKLFSLVLLMTAKSGALKIFYQNNNVLMKFCGENKKTAPIISALNGYTIYEIKENESLIIIPAKKAKNKSKYIKSDFEYLFDKFSVVNLIFKTK